MPKTQGYTDKILAEKQAEISSRKSSVKIAGLDDAYDLAQIIKHLIVDKKQTKYLTNGSEQCSTSRLRSIEDVTHIAVSYGLDINFEQAQLAAERLYLQNILTHSFCGTVKRQVHSPTRLTLTALEIRTALGDLNIKNPNYVRKTKKPIVRRIKRSSN